MTARIVPIIRYSGRISSALKRAADKGTHLTLSGLVQLLGPKAHRLLLLVAALFNMIPGPPGFGGTIAGLTFLIALAMVLNRPIRLPALIGNRKLPLKLLIKASDQIVRVASILARFSRPRMGWLANAAANVPYGIVVMIVSVVMALPVPLINAIPNVGLCIIAFSMLNRDGVGVLIGLVVAGLGLVVASAAVFAILHLGATALGWMQ